MDNRSWQDLDLNQELQNDSRTDIDSSHTSDITDSLDFSEFIDFGTCEIDLSPEGGFCDEAFLGIGVEATGIEPEVDTSNEVDNANAPLSESQDVSAMIDITQSAISLREAEVSTSVMESHVKDVTAISASAEETPELPEEAIVEDDGVTPGLELHPAFSTTPVRRRVQASTKSLPGFEEELSGATAHPNLDSDTVIALQAQTSPAVNKEDVVRDTRLQSSNPGNSFGSTMTTVGATNVDDFRLERVLSDLYGHYPGNVFVPSTILPAVVDSNSHSNAMAVPATVAHDQQLFEASLFATNHTAGYESLSSAVWATKPKVSSGAQFAEQSTSAFSFERTLDATHRLSGAVTLTNQAPETMIYRTSQSFKPSLTSPFQSPPLTNHPVGNLSGPTTGIDLLNLPALPILPEDIAMLAELSASNAKSALRTPHNHSVTEPKSLARDPKACKKKRAGSDLEGPPSKYARRKSVPSVPETTTPPREREQEVTYKHRRRVSGKIAEAAASQRHLQSLEAGYRPAAGPYEHYQFQQSQHELQSPEMLPLQHTQGATDRLHDQAQVRTQHASSFGVLHGGNLMHDPTQIQALQAPIVQQRQSRQLIDLTGDEAGSHQAPLIDFTVENNPTIHAPYMYQQYQALEEQEMRASRRPMAQYTNQAVPYHPQQYLPVPSTTYDRNPSTISRPDPIYHQPQAQTQSYHQQPQAQTQSHHHQPQAQTQSYHYQQQQQQVQIQAPQRPTTTTPSFAHPVPVRATLSSICNDSSSRWLHRTYSEPAPPPASGVVHATGYDFPVPMPTGRLEMSARGAVYIMERSERRLQETRGIQQ